MKRLFYVLILTLTLTTHASAVFTNSTPNTIIQRAPANPPPAEILPSSQSNATPVSIPTDEQPFNRPEFMNPTPVPQNTPRVGNAPITIGQPHTESPRPDTLGQDPAMLKQNARQNNPSYTAPPLSPEEVTPIIDNPYRTNPAPQRAP